MRALCITALILLLLRLLLQTKLRLRILYQEEALEIKLALGFLRYTAYPQKPKKKERAPKVPKEKAKKKRKRAKEELHAAVFSQIKEGLSSDLLHEGLRLGLELLSHCKNSLRIDELFIRLHWGLPDPANTALTYGYINAALGLFFVFLEGNFKVKKRKSEISLDYNLEKPRLFLQIACSISLWHLLCMGMRAGLAGFALYRRQKAAGEKNKTK